MKITRKLAFYGLILVSTLLLNACGGEKSTVNESKDRPHFEWVNAVVGTDIAPLGDISTTTPEFTWKFNRRTINTAKFKIGFEKTDGTGWHEFEIRQDTGVVECANPTPGRGNNRVCSATLPNYEFNPGDEIAWWVAFDTSNGWFWQLNAYVFKVAGGGSGGNSLIPQPISPMGSSSSQPVFEWETVNANTFTIGLEKRGGSWQEFNVNGKLNCPAQMKNKPSCWRSDYRLPISALSAGNYSWWIRADGKAWSNGADFRVAGSGGSPAIPQPISPKGRSSNQPVFTWDTVNANTFTIGLHQRGGAWKEFTFNGKLNCPVQKRNEPSCWRSDYRLPVSALRSGYYTWWIRTDSGDWNSGAGNTFSVGLRD